MLGIRHPGITRLQAGDCVAGVGQRPEKKPGYAGEPVGWQKRPLRASGKPGSRPTMKLFGQDELAQVGGLQAVDRAVVADGDGFVAL